MLLSPLVEYSTKSIKKCGKWLETPVFAGFSPIKNPNISVKIVNELHLAGVAADVLRYKYWVGSSFEKMIGQLNQMKAQWEISERFYFFDETDVITFGEAIRFLSSRWMEKQLSLQKKLLLTKDEAAAGSPPAPTAHKLLQKRKRRSPTLPGELS